MGEAKGLLVVPVGFNPSGELRSQELTANDFLRVYIEGGSVAVAGHNILDGAMHLDSLDGTVLRGDIIVGNATPKWSRLAKGSAAQVLTMAAGGNDPEWATPVPSGVASGTSNPGSPSAGNLFFRTDLGLLIYYDGVRWLTVNEFAAHIDQILSATASPTIAVNRTRTDFTKWFTRISGSTSVATTNEATKYWSIVIQGTNAGRSASSSIWSFDTRTDGVGTYVTHEAAPVTNNPTNQVWLDLQATKVSTPGALNAYFDAYFRLIVT